MTSSTHLSGGGGLWSVAACAQAAFLNDPIARATAIHGLVSLLDAEGADGKQANVSSTRLVQGIHEGIEGLKEIRILKKASFFYQAVYQAVKKTNHLMAKHQILSMSPTYILEFFLIVFVVSLISITVILQQDLMSNGTAQQFAVQLPLLSSGMYLIELSAGNTRVMRKVVVNSGANGY